MQTGNKRQQLQSCAGSKEGPSALRDLGQPPLTPCFDGSQEIEVRWHALAAGKLVDNPKPPKRPMQLVRDRQFDVGTREGARNDAHQVVR